MLDIQRLPNRSHQLDMLYSYSIVCAHPCLYTSRVSSPISSHMLKTKSSESEPVTVVLLTRHWFKVVTLVFLLTIPGKASLILLSFLVWCMFNAEAHSLDIQKVVKYLPSLYDIQHSTKHWLEALQIMLTLVTSGFLGLQF